MRRFVHIQICMDRPGRAWAPGGLQVWKPSSYNFGANGFSRNFRGGTGCPITLARSVHGVTTVDRAIIIGHPVGKYIIKKCVLRKWYFFYESHTVWRHDRLLYHVLLLLSSNNLPLLRLTEENKKNLKTLQ